MDFSLIPDLLIPDSLGLLTFAGLIVLSCLTSLLTASMGIGGGTVLLAVMAQVMPIQALIPVHGAVQLGSNSGRAALLWPKLRRDIAAWFLIGSLLGALVGGQIVVSIAKHWLQLVLGTFILFSVWGPKVTSRQSSAKGLISGGFLSTLLTMFVGATGPFVVALLRSFRLDAQTLVATSALCLVIQHAVKIIVFGILGFAYAPYLPLIGLMVISGFIGTLIGKKILINTQQELFNKSLNLILSLLALRLLYAGISTWL